MSKAIGIDLGTTYSAAAVFLGDIVTMIPTHTRNVLVPSMVAFNEDRILVGEEVRYQMLTNPKNSIYQVKRLMGKDYTDNSVEQDKHSFPFSVIPSATNQCKIQVSHKGKARFCSPEEISGYIIKKLKEYSEKHLKQPIREAVISVPAYFNNNQRAATKNAGILAGLDVKHIINEPTAAALAYGFGRDENDETVKNILVFDLGGGTFDISMLTVHKREFTVLAINGDNHLGGEDFTNRMVNYCLKEYDKKLEISINPTDQMKHRLREACEKAKLKLSENGQTSVDIELDNFYQKENREDDFVFTFTRKLFEEINDDLFNMTIELVLECLKNAEKKTEEIDEVILVGGSTKIPKVRQLLKEIFTEQKVNSKVNPHDVVALGAAIEAAILSGEKSDRLRGTKLIDVNPVSIGMGVEDNGQMIKVIKRNTRIPNKFDTKGVTSADNQEIVLFPIYEGESNNVEENILLGQFCIQRIPRGPAGSVVFDITFDLDKDGILNVTAVETKTKVSGRITITNDFGRLSPLQIHHLIKNDRQEVSNLPASSNRADKKRQLERYSFNVREFLSLNSTMESISARIEKSCRRQNEEIEKFLTQSESAAESEFDDKLQKLQSVCQPDLNKLYFLAHNRNLGDPNV